MNLLEQYSKRISLAEKYYAQNHDGKHMDDARKILVAKTIDNTSKFLNEAYDPATSATQLSGMVDYKKFCLALTNLVIPNLIAPELVHTVPMNSFTGNIAYAKFEKGTDKGESKEGDLVNNPWQFGKMDQNYTSSTVASEKHEYSSTTAGLNTKFPLDFLPLVDGGVAVVKDQDGATLVAGTDYNVDYEEGTITLTSALTSGKYVLVSYLYNNTVIPQEPKAALPTLKVKMDNITLQAQARRIAVRYSQLAAFQAKQDYGMDMAAELAKQAVGELSFEIDTEIVDMLNKAVTAATRATYTWSKTLPIGVSLRDHYAGFAQTIEQARTGVYAFTKKHMPNVILVAPDVIPVLNYIPGYTATGRELDFAGPFQCGTYNGMKVFCSPNLDPGTWTVIVNKNALEATAGVFGTYMPVVPTAILQGPDGGTSQGWSTLYDVKMLNDALVSGGVVVA